MNAQTNAVSDSRFDSQAFAGSPARPTHPFVWSIRRELWENRAIYIAPLIAAGFAILATLLASIHGHAIWISRNGRPPEQLPIPQQLTVIGFVIMAVTLVVAVFYSLDALYGERRDRSILFWRSLPVSDTTATLAKASIPILAIPLVTFVITAVTQWIVLAIDAVSIGHAATLGYVPLAQMQVALFYHLIAFHGLWYAPIFAWFLLVSAFAPKAPILWAVLPPLFIEIVEKMAFHTSYFSDFLAYRFTGGPSWIDMANGGISGMTMNPGHFLLSPGLWTGFIIAALFLAAAIQLRRYRSQN